MTYINLLYRQKSYAYFEYPEDWQKCVDQAVEWAGKSLEAQGMTVPENVIAATDRQLKAEGGRSRRKARRQRQGREAKGRPSSARSAARKRS